MPHIVPLILACVLWPSTVTLYVWHQVGCLNGRYR
jgi:hypothetical protein